MKTKPERNKMMTAGRKSGPTIRRKRRGKGKGKGQKG